MKISLLFVISTFNFGHICGQSREINAIKNNDVKVFNSKNYLKSKGLNFFISYPSFYSAESHNNENIVMQFVDNKKFNLIYNVGVVRTQDLITSEQKNIILLKSNLESSVNVVSPKAIFLNYKTDFKVSENDAAYIEYISKISIESKAFIRQYFIVYDNYLITMSFTIPVSTNETVEITKAKFNNFKPLFIKIAGTLKIMNNQNSTQQ